MEQQGLFTVNLIYPLIYMLIWMTIYAVGVAVLFMLPHSWFATILSGKQTCELLLLYIILTWPYSRLHCWYFVGTSWIYNA